MIYRILSNCRYCGAPIYGVEEWNDQSGEPKSFPTCRCVPRPYNMQWNTKGAETTKPKKVKNV